MSIKLFKLKKPVLKLAIGLCFSLPLYAQAELNKDMAELWLMAFAANVLHWIS